MGLNPFLLFILLVGAYGQSPTEFIYHSNSSQVTAAAFTTALSYALKMPAQRTAIRSITSNGNTSFIRMFLLDQAIYSNQPSEDVLAQLSNLISGGTLTGVLAPTGAQTLGLLHLNSLKGPIIPIFDPITVTPLPESHGHLHVTWNSLPNSCTIMNLNFSSWQITSNQNVNCTSVTEESSNETMCYGVMGDSIAISIRLMCQGNYSSITFVPFVAASQAVDAVYSGGIFNWSAGPYPCEQAFSRFSAWQVGATFKFRTSHRIYQLVLTNSTGKFYYNATQNTTSSIAISLPYGFIYNYSLTLACTDPLRNSAPLTGVLYATILTYVNPFSYVTTTAGYLGNYSYALVTLPYSDCRQVGSTNASPLIQMVIGRTVQNATCIELSTSTYKCDVYAGEGSFRYQAAVQCINGMRSKLTLSNLITIPSINYSEGLNLTFNITDFGYELSPLPEPPANFTSLPIHFEMIAVGPNGVYQGGALPGPVVFIFNLTIYNVTYSPNFKLFLYNETSQTYVSATDTCSADNKFDMVRENVWYVSTCHFTAFAVFAPVPPQNDTQYVNTSGVVVTTTEKSGLSGGAIAGIIIGSIFGAILIVGLIVGLILFIKRKRDETFRTALRGSLGSNTSHVLSLRNFDTVSPPVYNPRGSQRHLQEGSRVASSRSLYEEEMTDAERRHSQRPLPVPVPTSPSSSRKLPLPPKIEQGSLKLKYGLKDPPHQPRHLPTGERVLQVSDSTLNPNPIEPVQFVSSTDSSKQASPKPVRHLPMPTAINRDSQSDLLKELDVKLEHRGQAQKTRDISSRPSTPILPRRVESQSFVDEEEIEFTTGLHKKSNPPPWLEQVLDQLEIPVKKPKEEENKRGSVMMSSYRKSMMSPGSLLRQVTDSPEIERLDRTKEEKKEDKKEEEKEEKKDDKKEEKVEEHVDLDELDDTPSEIMSENLSSRLIVTNKDINIMSEESLPASPMMDSGSLRTMSPAHSLRNTSRHPVIHGFGNTKKNAEVRKERVGSVEAIQPIMSSIAAPPPSEKYSRSRAASSDYEKEGQI
ncbi:SH3 domain-containing protein [Planoprotostelium fungivorum]|uniref:SH3 domain-containing protein n=1 Tax=Planoprotostelium fungivorum TaxID=1890364 RepID=A0A2P6N6N4_9EUKA|nr:SH3 domain-containing protein [Planoprotostelium fungivorum]